MEDIIKIIDDCFENYQPMESKANLICQYLILKEHNPKNIVEIGTGAAGWALTISDLLQRTDINFFLFENFEETQYQNHEWWPKNKKDLMNYILAKNKNFQFDLSEKYSKVEKIDVLRYDAWGFSCQDFENIIEDCNKNSIVFFDDFSFNKDPDLVIMVLELFEKNLIYPIWASENSSCWSPSKDYSYYMIDFLKQKQSLIKQFTQCDCCYKQYNVSDLQFEMIQTKNCSK
jgi:spore coat polysaccharide biosynthesis predicted glycosyltransferase SpsG